MRDKPIMNWGVHPENASPIDGSFPEQQPRKYPHLSELIQSLGIEPGNLSLYYEAFTHASYSNEHRGNPSYDRLEFLGDAVVNLIAGNLLYEAHPDWPSGKLSRGRSSIVEGANLCNISVDLGFAPYVRFSEGEKQNAAFHGHIFEDVFEAFVGAVFLDRGYEVAREFLVRILTPYVSGAETAGVIDWKSRLQEEIQKEFKSGVTYRIISESGVAQEKRFKAACLVDGVVLGVGEGHNKKQAETEAAKEAYLARKRD